ncbi:hypothetical protein Clacol_000267 [Clathrus columnatus]|uniref:Inhibitor I9 domain-containing protein n=1 Tax=Clathrus columnatus TaxID=1419009 RepID=A0AAV4ZY62_9AGAM|nr:hypothetical protein Clacol_000267 [Clathrus columnatus]
MPQYIILFKAEASKEQIQSCKDQLVANGGQVTRDFDDLMKGFAADVPDQYVSSLQNFSPDSPIEYIAITLELT